MVAVVVAEDHVVDVVVGEAEVGQRLADRVGAAGHARVVDGGRVCPRASIT